MSAQFLDLLYGEAPREAFDAVVTDAIAAGALRDRQRPDRDP